MTEANHNATLGAQWADQRWGVDLRFAVSQIAEEHAICVACIWDKLRDFDGVDDPTQALALTVQFLNAERATGLEMPDVGQFLRAIFGEVRFETAMAFPTPGPIDESDKRAILRRAGFAPTLDQELGSWVADDIEMIDGDFSADLAWRAAWELFLGVEEVYRHYKGGVYIRGCDGRSSEDGSEIVVYEHLWPHEPEIWTRPKAEFDEPGRFVRMTAS